MKFRRYIFLILFFATLPVAAQQPTKAYIVPNAHLDTQWRWTVQTTIDEFLYNTLMQNFKYFETVDGYVFNFEGAVKYSWMKEYYPDLFEKLKGYVGSGQWHVSGSSWDANDTNIPSAESAFRNILYGQEFYQKEFGIKSTDIMLPDCFGFSAALPSIAAHCGLIGFGTQKLAWRTNPFYEDGRKYPFPFGIWRGIDGSEIMIAMDGGDYNWDPKALPVNTDALDKLASRTSVPAVYKYIGSMSPRYQCDRGGSPTPFAVHAVAGQKIEGYDCVFAASDQMFKDYYMDSRLPVFDGELLMDVHGTGCYTSKVEMKRLNRQNEQMLGAAEVSSVMSDFMGGIGYPFYVIDNGWKRILWHQFHDDLTGTSLPEAYNFSYNDEYLNLNQMESVIRSAVSSVATTMDTETKGSPLLVYNPAPVRNSDYVTTTVSLSPDASSISVRSPEGRMLKSQIIARSGDSATVIFSSKSAPASISVYDLSSGRASSTSALKTGERSIENKIYRIRLDENGDISSIFDKRYGKELVKAGDSFSLEMIHDNVSDSWPSWEITKEVIDRAPEAVTEDVRISVEETGPLRATLKVERRCGKSVFVQRISLTDGACDDRIDIRCEVDWESAASLLKASFSTSFTSSKASYDIGLGYVARGVNTTTAYEVPGQKWADMTADDGSYGITVLNDSRYGWDKPDLNTLRLTLFHTPDIKNNRYKEQSSQDFGCHSFTYSIIGHKGHLDAPEADASATVMNTAKVAILAEKHAGKAGRTLSMVSTSDNSIAIKAVKKAQDSDGIIVRVHETAGRNSSALLEFPTSIESAEEVNGLEETVDPASFSANKLSVSADAFSPKTYRVRLEPMPVKASMPQYSSLDLPYDAIAYSTDEFVAYGHMDKAWHSYAGELIPEKFEFCGIPFIMGKPDFNDAVRCDGQSLTLPQGTEKLYLLAASSDGDRMASFKTGDTECRLKVENFSGLWGNYGWPGYSESVRKDGKVAYVGTHRHDSDKHNESCICTYMFLLEIPVPEGCSCVALPKDKDVVVFSATAAGASLHN